MKIFLLVVLHLSKVETFLGWQSVAMYGTILVRDWLTEWHKVIKKLECERLTLQWGQPSLAQDFNTLFKDQTPYFMMNPVNAWLWTH